MNVEAERRTLGQNANVPIEHSQRRAELGYGFVFVVFVPTSCSTARSLGAA